MKKVLLFALFLFVCSAFVNSQTKDFGELRNNKFYIGDRAIISVGDFLTFGKATGCYENCFENIYYEPEDLFSKIKNKFSKNVYAVMSGKRVVIRKFLEVNRNGKKVWLVVLQNMEKKENYYCFLQAALEAGEIEISSENLINSAIRPEILPPDKITDKTPIVNENTDNKKDTINNGYKINEQNSSKKASIADELIKLKTLLDESVITREEFEKIKQRLLN